MEQSNNIWLSVVGVLGALLGGSIGTQIINWYKQRNQNKLDIQRQSANIDLAKDKATAEQRVSEIEKAFVMLKDIAESLKKDIIAQSQDVKNQEKANLELREQNAKLREQIATLTAQLQYLQKSAPGVKP